MQVVQATLHGFDCVYAPLISGYGSVCATLEASPGTRVSTFVTHLTHVQVWGLGVGAALMLLWGPHSQHFSTASCCLWRSEMPCLASPALLHPLLCWA